MRKCPRCSREFDDQFAICRTCGAILDAAETPGRAEMSCPPVLPKPGPTIGETPARPPRLPPSHWACPRCQETVPDAFEVCWNCGTSREGIADPQFRREPSDDGPRVSAAHDSPDSVSMDEPPEGTEAPHLHREPPEVAQGDPAAHAPPDSVFIDELPGELCPRCGAAKMIPNPRLVDRGQNSRENLCVVVYGDPEAILFKDRLYGRLAVNVCGQCGHVEWQVENPGELYEKYRQSRGYDTPPLPEKQQGNADESSL